MEEKRKYQRSDVNEPAYVSADGSVMSCMVRNISPEGAAIDIEDPAFVPTRFRLVMSGGGRGEGVPDCLAPGQAYRHHLYYGSVVRTTCVGLWRVSPSD
jgi:hypothetical protein